MTEEAEPAHLSVVFWGTYDLSKPLTRILREGLREVCGDAGFLSDDEGFHCKIGYGEQQSAAGSTGSGELENKPSHLQAQESGRDG